MGCSVTHSLLTQLSGIQSTAWIQQRVVTITANQSHSLKNNLNKINQNSHIQPLTTGKKLDFSDPRRISHVQRHFS